MRLKVYRYNKTDKESRFDTYEFDTKPGLTVLGSLFHIQDHFDDSLSFRYSCRGAVCGSCAMLINKVPRLACRTQIDSLIQGSEVVNLKPYPALEITTTWNPSEEVLVEPLPNLPKIKDLVVDMDRFFIYYRKIQPVFKPSDVGDIAPEKERLMKPEMVKELENYTNCILCASCFGACPVDSKNSNYLGPAALAKLFRFYLDVREGDNISRLESANNPDGWWTCEFHTNCKKVCPKGVPPNLAIGKARKVLKDLGKEPNENMK
jgi:succinate dehydrogenase / fumarate reductase iron-sulfur subunit